MLSGIYYFMDADYFMYKYPVNVQDDTWFMAANFVATLLLGTEIELLEPGNALKHNDVLIAFRGRLKEFQDGEYLNVKQTESEFYSIENIYDIFQNNGTAIEEDFKLVADSRTSEKLSSTVNVIGDLTYSDGSPKLFVEPGAKLEYVTLNLTNGPIYIGTNVEIQEGSVIRGPFAACDHAVVNINSKIYGPTTLGPYCKVGGELNNVVMFGYSNKAHEGFLGNAVIGQWCNLGAGTNASNLKNDYSEVKLWSYAQKKFVKTGLQFCGLIMGDFSKAGINTMFNTATVVGVGCNIYGAGFPRTFIPSFSEGGNAGFTNIDLNKFYDAASRMMARRNIQLTDEDKDIFKFIEDQAESFK